MVCFDVNEIPLSCEQRWFRIDLQMVYRVIDRIVSDCDFSVDTFTNRTIDKLSRVPTALQ